MVISTYKLKDLMTDLILIFSCFSALSIFPIPLLETAQHESQTCKQLLWTCILLGLSSPLTITLWTLLVLTNKGY